jgi:hypothetical protein
MLRKTIHATLIVILMMGAASAEDFFKGGGENSLRNSNREKKEDRAIDRKQIDNDYRAATSKIPDRNVLTGPPIDIADFGIPITTEKAVPVDF